MRPSRVPGDTVSFSPIGTFFSVCLRYHIRMTWSQNIWTGRKGYQFV